jgi:NAD-dependent deacetylase
MNKLLIFAGAGISAESGLKTFRDDGGIWTTNNVNELCNYHTFTRSKNDENKRRQIFDFYNYRKKETLKVDSNLAHQKIAEWQKEYGKNRVKIVTSNIDNLFEKAGVEDVVHVHGDLENMHCVACQHKWAKDEYDYMERCPKCNSRLTKPHVVFFGERAPEYMKMHSIFNHKKRGKEDIILVIGTSFEVISAETIVQRKNINTILINKDETIQDNWFNHKLIGLATEKILEAEFIIKNSLK